MDTESQDKEIGSYLDTESQRYGKKPRFVSSVGFRVLKNNEKSRFVSGVSGGIPKNRIPKDSFLSVLGRWIYRFQLSVLGLDIWISAFGSWALNVRVSTFGWALDIWVLTFGWALDIWIILDEWMMVDDGGRWWTMDGR
ncbi:unnamed protein product [Rhizophagus irregularis]|nr:unnamed protein product [Rhizophagus irregularis]